LRVSVYDDVKIVTVWLTRSEEQNDEVEKQIQQMCKDYTAKKYKVAVFHSGTDSFYECVKDLVVYNRTRSAELELQREKEAEYSQTPSGQIVYSDIQC